MLKRFAVWFSASTFLIALGSGSLAAEKPRIAPVCKQCHVADDKVLRGNFMSASQKAETIQIQIGTATWLVKYDDDTKLIGVEKINKIPKEREIGIEIEDRNGQLYAKAISVKPPATVPAEKLIGLDELSRLIEDETKKGTFVLIDSRPSPRYREGHIPGAISIYDAEFDKNIEKLPKNKDVLLIFYCGGTT